MPTDGVVTVGTQVNLGPLRSGFAEAQAAVEAASRNMAAAQAQFGKAAEQGSVQAAEALKLYQTELIAAQSALAGLTGAEERETAVLRTSISARMAASAELRVMEGNIMGSTRAAGALLSMLPGVGAALQVAFPIFGAVALIGVLGDVAEKAAKLYDEFVNLRAIQDEAWKAISKSEEDAIQVSEEHLHTMREQQVVSAELRGNKTGRSFRGAEAGANFDLAQAKNDLAIVNEQIAQYRSQISDLQRRAQAVHPFSQLTKDARGSDQKLATIELGPAQEALNAKVKEQQELEDKIGLSASQTALRKREEGEAEATLAKSEEARLLAADHASAELIDRQAKKEEELFKKLDEIKTKGNETVGHMGLQKDFSLDSYVDDQIKLFDAQTKLYDIQQKNQAAINEASIRYQAATGTITPLEAAYAMAAEHARQFKQEQDELNASLAVQEQLGQDTAAAQTRNAIAQLQGKEAVTGLQDKANIANQIAQPWVRSAGQVADAWTEAFNKILIGGPQSWHAVQNAASQMAMSAIRDAEQVATKFIEQGVRQLAAHVTVNQAKVTSDASASAQTQSISLIDSIKQVSHEAAVAAAKAWSALAGIPIIGPELGAVAAAATYAGVLALASFDQGTSYIPRDGMAMLHKGEAVLPPPQTEALMRALSGGGSQQSGRAVARDINLHYYGRGNSDSRDLASHLARVARMKNL